MPFTVKESIALRGMPQSTGLVMRRDFRATETAPPVQRLIDAGAIPLGVTNTSELSLWIESTNRVYGCTNNPYDPARTAGGSSGGEGAAVGSGASPFGVGSDIGGSIRVPAFFCGVFGHKPSPGLVPNTGHYPPTAGRAAEMLATGPLVRRAEDLMPLLSIMAGPGRRGLVRDRDDDRRSRVGLARGAAGGDRRARVAAADVAGAERCARARDRRARVRGRDGPADRASVVAQRGAAVSGDASGQRRATAHGAADRGGRGGADVARRWRGGVARTRCRPGSRSRPSCCPDPAAPRAGDCWRPAESLASELKDAIGDGVLLHPAYPRTAPRHGRTVGRPWLLTPSAVFNLAGVPVTEVPLGLTPRGLPIGVQVAASPGHDHLSIAVALELERVFGGWVPPPEPVR